MAKLELNALDFYLKSTLRVLSSYVVAYRCRGIISHPSSIKIVPSSTSHLFVLGADVELVLHLLLQVRHLAALLLIAWR
jgi:hypothetical protein